MQERGVEPLHLSVQDPKSCASANSATPALEKTDRPALGAGVDTLSICMGLGHFCWAGHNLPRRIWSRMPHPRPQLVALLLISVLAFSSTAMAEATTQPTGGVIQGAVRSEGEVPLSEMVVYL